MSSDKPSSSSHWEAPLPEEMQRLLPQYEITGILGRGGMGAVYKGRQKNLDRDVAIKVLPENFTKGDDELNFVARFKQEAKAMAKLDHPAILSVHDFGETSEGHLYFVMEFIDGMDIHQYLKHHGGKLPQESALAITAHVLDALDYAHNHGIVHRDIKPANILLNHEGRVKIADFGLAKKFGEHAEADAPALTMSNVAVGTPDFVAPEALDSDQTPDHRADLYAVGVMLYQMLTGKLPRGNVRWPSELDSGIDPRLDDIVSKAMESNPEHRYQTAAAVRADLDLVLSQPMAKVEAGEKSGEVAAVVPVTSSVKGKKGTKGRKEEGKASKLPVYLGVSLVAVLVVGLVVMATRGSNDSPPGTAGVPPAAPLPAEDVPTEPRSGQWSPRRDARGPGVALVAPEKETAKSDDFPVAVVETKTEPTPDVAAPEPVPAETPPTALSPPPSETPLAEAAPAEPPPTAAMAMPTEQSTASTKPNQEPSTKNEELLTLPGLQSRLDAFLSARRAQVEDLAGKYRRGLDSRLNQAADAGDLPLAKAFRDEIARVEGLQSGLAIVPEDRIAAVAEFADLPELPEASPESLVTLRSAWGTERAKIREDLDGKLGQSLQVLESDLTRAREFEQAEAVLAYRESLEERSAGTSVADLTEVGANVPPASVPGPVTLEAETPATKDLAAATKEEPFENSLGMKFVPVPGTEVLFCIHETRWRDYDEYAKDVDNVAPNWKSQKFGDVEIKGDEKNLPVVNVNWEDAKDFCRWLSEREKKSYRLPTDREWSIAVGIGDIETWDADTTPGNVFRSPDIFPWGRTWPPPPGSGNYGDERRKEKVPASADTKYIEGYDDGYPVPAPVMSFTPNRHGLFDMSGNVAEWVEDWYDANHKGKVLRGGSWSDGDPKILLSSYRNFQPIDFRSIQRGFRIVLETGDPDTAPGSVTPATAPAAPAGVLKNPFGWQPLPENPFPLPRPTRPTTPCRVVAWRLDGQPVDEAAFRTDFGGVPANLGEVVDLEARNFGTTRFVYPLALSASGKVLALHRNLQRPIPEDLKAAVVVSGGRDFAAALHTDGTVTHLFLSTSALQKSESFADVTSWKDIVQISTSDGHVFGLDAKGVLFAAGTNERDETNIPAPLRSDIVSVHLQGPTGKVLQNRAKDYHVAYVGMGSGNFSHDTPKNSRVFLSTNIYVADEKGVIRYCNVGRSYPSSTENLRGSTRDVRDISVTPLSQQKENGIAALREGEDQWRFWGDRKELGGFDPTYCEEKAAGCWKLFFIGDYVFALKPVANLKPDDWTGAAP